MTTTTNASVRSMAPANHAAAVTKSDSTVFSPAASALYVGGTGDVVVTTEGGEDATFIGVPTGFILPIRCTKVKAATTATNIVRLWQT